MPSELSPVHRLWRLLPPRARRRAASGAAELLAPRPDPHPPARSGGVTVAGEIGRASGLGEGARIMAGAVAALGIPVARREAGVVLRGERSELAQEQGGAEPPDALLVLHVNPPLLPAALLRLGRRQISHRRLVGYWAWELTAAPPGWQRGARFVHEAWVPSEFVRRALEPLLPGRVRVVPHALAARPAAPRARARADFGLPADALVVLASFNLASSFERKNPIGTVRAFQAAFGDRRDRHLLLKIGKGGHFPAETERLLRAVSASPNITVETRTFDAADNLALIGLADIVLSLHRSEGFGLVIAEAMMLGRAVISTDWSAPAEYLDATCGVPVPCRQVPVHDPRRVYDAPGAFWAEPDHDAAVESLRALAGDEAGRLSLGAAARARAHERFGTAGLRLALAAAGVRAP